MSDRIVLYVNGAVAYDNQAGPVTPPPNPPDPVPIPPNPPANYPGPDMWLYANKRRAVLLTTASPISRGGFTVPAGNTKTVELLESGANINMLYDGVLNGGGEFLPTPGPHTFDAELTSGATSAEGSITCQHAGL